MRIRCLVSAKGNRLYDGKYALRGRFQTYGQQSLMLDFVTVAVRLGIELEICCDAPSQYALRGPLSRFGRVLDLQEASGSSRPDLIVLDLVTDEMLDALLPGVPTVSWVHYPSQPFTAALTRACCRFICMSETALAEQRKRISETTCHLVHQGVDTERFRMEPDARRTGSTKKVLVYSRLDAPKAENVVRAVETLIELGLDVTVLGDGEAFWDLSDRWGDRMTLVNYIPCHSIHRFLPHFDLIVSSGRGVMEGLACGKPVLCAGWGYGGLVRQENIPTLLRRNLTGYGLLLDRTAFTRDVAAAFALQPSQCRELAERHFSGERFVKEVLTAATVPIAAGR